MVDKTIALPLRHTGADDPEVTRTPSLSHWRRPLYHLSYGVQMFAPVFLCPPVAMTKIPPNELVIILVPRPLTCTWHTHHRWDVSKSVWQAHTAFADSDERLGLRKIIFENRRTRTELGDLRDARGG
jgi:hypothetical protein